MQVTGTNYNDISTKSIRLQADGFSVYDGREVVLVASRSTWMPMNEFSADRVQAIYDRVYTPSAQPYTVRYNILPTLEVIELWSVDKRLEQQLTAQYPHHRWMGVNGVVIERVAAYERQHTSGSRLYIYVHDGEMLVFDFARGALHYANSFWPANGDEARYFALAAWRSLSLDAEKDECMLMGDCQQLVSLLSPYLRHVGELAPAALRISGDEKLPFDVRCVF